MISGSEKKNQRLLLLLLRSSFSWSHVLVNKIFGGFRLDVVMAIFQLVWCFIDQTMNKLTE